MAVRDIVRYPDLRLKTVAAPVTVFDDALAGLAVDLLDTLRAAPGIGITAPHVGVPARVVVLELSPEEGPRTYVNPQIIARSDEMMRHMEGSISMPGVTDELDRHARVTVRFQELDGTVREEEAEGLRAVCHQHEIDQLDGIFWVQRLSRLRRDRLVRRYEKLGR